MDIVLNTLMTTRKTMGNISKYQNIVFWWKLNTASNWTTVTAKSQTTMCSEDAHSNRRAFTKSLTRAEHSTDSRVKPNHVIIGSNKTRFIVKSVQMGLIEDMWAARWPRPCYDCSVSIPLCCALSCVLFLMYVMWNSAKDIFTTCFHKASDNSWRFAFLCAVCLES